MTIKAYTLFGVPGGRVTNQSKHHHGASMRVAAKSIKQAYYLAGHNQWINPKDKNPVGVLSFERLDRDMPISERLWCGCWVSGSRFSWMKNLAGIREIRAAIEETLRSHDCILDRPPQLGPGEVEIDLRYAGGER